MKRLTISSVLLMWLTGCATSSDLEDTRRQIDIVNKQASTRLAEVEGKLANDKLLDLVSQLDTLKSEQNKVHGELEVLNYNLQTLQKRQQDLYNDLDARLARFEGTSTNASAPAEQATGTEASPDYDKALNLLRHRDFVNATIALQRFIKQNPSTPEAVDATYWLGVAHTAQRQYDAAIDIHRRFVEQYPDHPKAPDALRNIANCQRDLKQVDIAKATLRRLIKLYPKSAAAVKAKEQLARM